MRIFGVGLPVGLITLSPTSLLRFPTIAFCCIMKKIVPLLKVNPRFVVQESLLSIFGAGLFLTVGLITLDSYSHPQYGAPLGKVGVTIFKYSS